LGEILDRLHRLPADAFSERLRLRDRQAELQRQTGGVRDPRSGGDEETLGGGQRTNRSLRNPPRWSFRRWRGAAVVAAPGGEPGGLREPFRRL